MWNTILTASQDMAQQFPTTPEVIYSTLSGDAQFMSSIGDYKFKGNATTSKAISIVTPGSDIPSLESVSGVECVIHDLAALTRRDYLTDASDIDNTWNVYLIAWAPATGTEVNAAAYRAMSRFSGSTATEVVAVSDGLGALAQVLLTIPSNRPILA